MTNEVLLEWSSAISRSFVPVMLWAPATLALLAIAGWCGLRSVMVPRLPAGLAVLTLCLTPPLTHWQKNGAHTDLPALAWLLCAAALCAASVGRPQARRCGDAGRRAGGGDEDDHAAAGAARPRGRGRDPP